MPAPKKYADKPHARIYGEWENYPAWTTLSPYARCILIVLLMDYRPEKNFLVLSDREAARRGNCSRPTAANAIQELQDKGWIGVARVGKTKGNREARASAYYLTCYPEEIGVPATHDYRNWKPERPKKKPPTAKICATNGQNIDHRGASQSETGFDVTP